MKNCGRTSVYEFGGDVWAALSDCDRFCRERGFPLDERTDDLPAQGRRAFHQVKPHIVGG